MFKITGEPSQKEDVYLVRYVVFKTRFLSLYIHRFMRSDSSDPHDHPWNFFTYVVSGSYKEHFYDTMKPRERKDYFFTASKKRQFTSLWTPKINIRKAGSLAYRRAEDIHWVETDKVRSIWEINEAPLTICLILRRRRRWGFWTSSHTFVDWRKFLKVRPNDPRIEGAE
jgi:hypothetical protein